MNDEKYMQQAVLLAQKGAGYTSPNPCVGAVVVKDGQVVGKGWHKGPGLAHAEVNAIDDAKEHARGATIYVTLEPCNHFGKTPPCTHKIRDAGIEKVVVGCEDPNPFVAGGGIAFLRNRGIEVVSGVLEKECRTLIEAFIWYVNHEQTPFVILKCAATLDGRIAASTGDSRWVTGSAARRHVHQVRHEVDGILIGSGTLHADDPSLTARRDGETSRDPARIILDTHLSIDEGARVLTLESQSPTILVAGPDADPQKQERLTRMGARVIHAPLAGSGLDLNQVMIKLGEIGIQSLLIEGGGEVIYSVLKAGIVNKVMFYTAPKILGGDDGIPVCRGKGPELMKDAFELDDVEVRMFDRDILIQGYINR
ncbi:MAG: bifunctional diaminohydroxyphosphoribosylaminopyrimidine deaminase/5-amino-6-(5-phosphoribosylamino)uracil reductase RibD [Desulfobacteraceae bacterium]|nr:MAG: bifunctional diaminohydroxyphosphoribosylaminopyrimidine deaminase/5-amino-6-(5-phosphoribosylamino)uracil reductase RibD [Desulfobacteraceae bacterium]